MKRLLSVVLWFSCITSSIYPSYKVQDKPLFTRSEHTAPLLVLETGIKDERHEVEEGLAMLRWNLTLTYKNLGAESILLYKKSSLIYRSMVSKSLKAASKAQYEEDTSSHFISANSMRAAGFQDGVPDAADFVTLKPGETYSIQSEYGVQRRGISSDGGGLTPGQYFLEVRVATWYYFVDPKEYREKWRSAGYLWSENMKSQPMRFTLQ